MVSTAVTIATDIVASVITTEGLAPVASTTATWIAAAAVASRIVASTTAVWTAEAVAASSIAAV
jgi:hypothetical protein